MTRVILYYNFSPIARAEAFCVQHKIRCQELNLKGRVYVSREGINGTLAGDNAAIGAYKAYLCSIPGFEKTEFKEEACSENPFYKLIVKIRPEIVSLKAKAPVDPKRGGAYLEPREWRRLLESEKDFILLDVRNQYETKIGHFEGAILPPLENFFDFPQWLEEAQLDKNKKVLMYCTGGIRCEKFSALMKAKGFTNIFQLHGGIINYAKKENGAHFKGKCFVFDDRLAVPVNPKEPGPISRCEISGGPCDTYINCANPVCNRLFLCTEEAAVKMEGCCSEDCRRSPNKRPFDIEKIYQPFRKWYHYFSVKPS